MNGLIPALNPAPFFLEHRYGHTDPIRHRTGPGHGRLCSRPRHRRDPETPDRPPHFPTQLSLRTVSGSHACHRLAGRANPGAMDFRLGPLDCLCPVVFGRRPHDPGILPRQGARCQRPNPWPDPGHPFYCHQYRRPGRRLLPESAGRVYLAAGRRHRPGGRRIDHHRHAARRPDRHPLGLKG